jgi:inorganic triphosphatase YgiF
MTSTNAVSTTRETERKYEAPDEVRLPDPDSLLGPGTGAVANDQPADEQNLDAIYFDTPDLALARAGITLRRRDGGSDPGWHLKLPAGSDSRNGCGYRWVPPEMPRRASSPP